LILLVASCPVLAYSATPLELQWSNTYDSHRVSSVIQAHDGSVMIAGSVTINYKSVASFMKLNGDGSVEWEKTYHSSEGVYWEIHQVGSGYILSSRQGSFLKTNEYGDIEWDKKFDLNERQHIPVFVVTEDGGCIIVKTSYSVGHFYPSVCKYDVNDVLLWEKTFSQTIIEAILLSNNGDGYYVAGGQGKDFWFAKLDLYGEVVWSRVYSYRSLGSTNLVFNSVILTQDGGFLLGGSDDRYGWIVKTDCDGKEQWHRQYDSPVRDIVQDRNGQYLVFSAFEIIGVDVRGRELWTEPYSKYIVEFDSLGVDTVVDVSSVIGEEGNLVVAASYLIDVYPNVVVDFYGLCVTKFVVEYATSLNNYVLLFGVVTTITVTVFVCIIIYLKKCKRIM
jgi:hypothetical protein